jgi:hypothetical protein
LTKNNCAWDYRKCGFPLWIATLKNIVCIPK